MLSPLLKKLLFVRQLSMGDGKIEILGNRHIMLSDNALLDLQEIDESKFYDVMKSSTLKQLEKFVEHAKVYKNLKSTAITDIASLSRKLSSAEGIVKTVQEIFDLYGLGVIEIIRLDNKGKRAAVRVSDSTIARAYLKKNKKRSGKPVCVITAAVIAGLFTYLFQKEVNAAENRCLARGNSKCEFVIQ